MRKLAVFTATRAEYGLLRPILRTIEESDRVALQLIVSGTHLSALHGNTVDQIKQDGYSIDAYVDSLEAEDSIQAINSTMAKTQVGVAGALQQLQPDLLIVLGDRYELLSCVTAAMIVGIPVVHLHGGELTTGAIDDAIRHAITKLSHIHMTGTQEYRNRVIQLGEQPELVFNVGATAVDNAAAIKPISKKDLEAALGFKLREQNVLITFHPETLSPISVQQQLKELFAALDSQPDLGMIFTMPNADKDFEIIDSAIKNYVAASPHTRMYRKSLGNVLYMNTLRHMDAMVGNSSSGITEGPILNVPTVNIGNRQDGRVRASSILDVPCRSELIVEAISNALNMSALTADREAASIYGSPGVSHRIIKILEEIDLTGLRQKKFYDLPIRSHTV